MSIGPNVGARFGFGFEDHPSAMTFEDNNSGVTPSFLFTELPDVEATEREGRPIKKMLETVLLKVAGDSFSVTSKPVDDEIKNRFPEQYRRWCANREDSEAVSGTPLKMWPMITVAEVASLNAINIFNVEGLANVADVYLAKSPSLRELRAKAESWLEQAKTGAEAMRLRTELEKRDVEMDEMRASIAELKSALGTKVLADGAAEHVKRGPGRPKKEAEAA